MSKPSDLMRQGYRVYNIFGLSKKELRYLSNRLFLNLFYDEEKGLLFVKTRYDG